MHASADSRLTRTGVVAGSIVLVLTLRVWLAVALGLVIIAGIPAPAGVLGALAAGVVVALLPYRSAREVRATFRRIRGRETLPFMRGLLLSLFFGLAGLWLGILAFVEMSSGVATDPASVPAAFSGRLALIAVIVSVTAGAGAAAVWLRHPSVWRPRP